jgi:hypothetical protein
MSESQLSKEEVVELGESIYGQKIKSNVEPQFLGKFLAIDVRTGNYEMGDRILSALQQAQAKLGDQQFYIKRIGYPSVARIGRSD